MNTELPSVYRESKTFIRSFPNSSLISVSVIRWKLAKNFFSMFLTDLRLSLGASWLERDLHTYGVLGVSYGPSLVSARSQFEDIISFEVDWYR
jgi:hypothetical protein